MKKRLAPRKLEPTGHSPTLSCLMSEARRGLVSGETTVHSGHRRLSLNACCSFIKERDSGQGSKLLFSFLGHS